MLLQIESLRGRHHQPLVPKKCALLILDMQKYFLEESSHAFIPSGRTIIPGICNLIKICEAKEIPVIFSRHTNIKSDAAMMGKWWHDLILPEDAASEMIEGFDLSTSEVIEKSQYDAFYKTKLEEILRKQQISQLIICGVMTHLCCETTARSAFMRGFEIFFPVDGTATYNELFHQATLQNLAHGFAVPILIEQIIANINKTNED